MAQVVGVHGVRGTVKLKVFCADARDLPGYSPLCGPDGKDSLSVRSVAPHGNVWLAEIAGVADRTAAEKLRGAKLCLPRDRLPEIGEDNTFYHTDLVGLAAQYPSGAPLGRVVSVANFGAGDLLEIKPQKGASFYVPFTADTVPAVDIAGGTVTVDPPPGLID